MNRLWYAVRTNPNSEYLAATSLEREGFELFFPRVLSYHPHAEYRRVPLFPGYLFVRYGAANGWLAPVHQLPGVSGWVRFDGVAPSVPDEVVARLAGRVAELNQGGGLWMRFRPGDKVRVVSGPMDSLAEVVDEPNSPRSRVKVLLEFLGRRTSAEVPWHVLRKANDDPSSASGRGRPRRTRGRGRWIRGSGPRAAVFA